MFLWELGFLDNRNALSIINYDAKLSKLTILANFQIMFVCNTRYFAENISRTFAEWVINNFSLSPYGLRVKSP